MCKKNQKQMPLMPSDIEHPRAKELDRISEILESIPTITDMVLQDLTHGVKHRHCGAQGMSAEQVLRAAIIKQTEGFSYEELAFRLIDSRTYRNFCRIGITHKGFKRSALCKNIKSISPETWESINRLLTAYGDDKKGDFLFATAFGINSAGQIAGYARKFNDIAGTQAILWDPAGNSMETVGTSAGPNFARDIREAPFWVVGPG